MSATVSIDHLMETLVVPSFTRLGPTVRRRLFDWEDLTARSMRGRVVAITGATSGLGAEVARTLASMGAAIVLIARDPAKAAAAAASIGAAPGAPEPRTYLADMADVDAVRSAATEILDHEPALDVLINNAGGIVAKRTLTPAGVEATFATMVLGPFALTNLLVPLLRESQDARVITVTSGGMYTQGLHVDDLQMAATPYRGATAYARAKRAQVVLTRLWAQRLREDGVAVHAMHPGWADTPGLVAGLPRFRRVLGPILRTPGEGADTIVWLAAADEPARSTGGLWLDRRLRPTDRLRSTRVSRADAERLWTTCVALSGTDLPGSGP